MNGWRALGFSETLGFIEQCRGTRHLPDEVVGLCLALAARVFGVVFARRTTQLDEEHGRTQSVFSGDLAEYDSSPTRVLTIVYAPLRGDIWATDDADLPGFADECLQRLRQLQSSKHLSTSPAPEVGRPLPAKLSSFSSRARRKTKARGEARLARELATERCVGMDFCTVLDGSRAPVAPPRWRRGGHLLHCSAPADRIQRRLK